MNLRASEIILIVILVLLFTRRGSAKTMGRTVGRVGAPPRPEPPRAAAPESPRIETGYEKYYRILEVKPSASADEIQRAYRELVKVWHPDRFQNDPSLKERANAKLREINEAYEILTSRRRR